MDDENDSGHAIAEKVRDVFDYLQDEDVTLFAEGAEDRQIEAFENRAGIRLPEGL